VLFFGKAPEPQTIHLKAVLRCDAEKSLWK
jgi:hypothetical protein